MAKIEVKRRRAIRMQIKWQFFWFCPACRKLQLSIESGKDNKSSWDSPGCVYAHMVPEIKTSWNCFSSIICSKNFHFVGFLFPCVYKRDMNNIRRIRAIISNNILLLIAFDQTLAAQTPDSQPFLDQNRPIIPSAHQPNNPPTDRPTDRFGYYKLISCAMVTKVTAGQNERARMWQVGGSEVWPISNRGALLKIVQNLHFILTETVVAFEHTLLSTNPLPSHIHLWLSGPACYTILKQIWRVYACKLNKFDFKYLLAEAIKRSKWIWSAICPRTDQHSKSRVNK